MAVTVTLGRPRAKLRVTVHFRDLSTEPQELRADMIIGIYQPVEENQEKGIDVQAKGVLPGAYPGMWPSVSVLKGEWGRYINALETFDLNCNHDALTF